MYEHVLILWHPTWTHLLQKSQQTALWFFPIRFVQIRQGNSSAKVKHVLFQLFLVSLLKKIIVLVSFFRQKSFLSIYKIAQIAWATQTKSEKKNTSINIFKTLRAVTQFMVSTILCKIAWKGPLKRPGKQLTWKLDLCILKYNKYK